MNKIKLSGYILKESYMDTYNNIMLSIGHSNKITFIIPTAIIEQDLSKWECLYSTPRRWLVGIGINLKEWHYNMINKAPMNIPTEEENKMELNKRIKELNSKPDYTNKTPHNEGYACGWMDRDLWERGVNE